MTFTMFLTNNELHKLSKVLVSVDLDYRDKINSLLKENRTVDFGGYKITTMRQNTYELEISSDLSDYLITGPVLDIISMIPKINKIFKNLIIGFDEYIEKDPIVTEYDDYGDIIFSTSSKELLEQMRKEEIEDASDNEENVSELNTKKAVDNESISSDINHKPEYAILNA